MALRGRSAEEEVHSVREVSSSSSAAEDESRTQRVTHDRGWLSLSEEEQSEYAEKIMRHVLCRHALKIPVKRNELSKLLFSSAGGVKGRASILNGALGLAQENFQNVMGCEIVEIVKQTRMYRGSTIATQTSNRSVIVQRSQQIGSVGTTGGTMTPPTSSGVGAKAYILVSKLPVGARAPNENEWALRAFLSIVASLILLEPGCRILEDDLYQALNRSSGIRVDERGGHRQLNDGNVKELLEKILVQQWYLEREKEDRSYYYMIGPRLRAELNDEDLLAFIAAVYQKARGEASIDPAAVKELQQRLDAARGALPDELASSDGSEE